MDLKPVIEFDINSPHRHNENFIYVDEWDPKPEDILFTFPKGYMVAPLTTLFNLNIDPEIKFDYFTLTPKKSYYSNTMRDHLIKYLNYFEKFYDIDREYISILYRMKIIIDRYGVEVYPIQIFFEDMYRYILTSEIHTKISKMVEDNYRQNLQYKNKNYPSLQYTDYHAKLLHRMALLMDLCIPLLTNYYFMNKLDINIDEYLLLFYDKILNLYSVDMQTKLYETAYSAITQNIRNNKPIWDKQDIRGIDITTQSMDSVKNILINIMPRYSFANNIISFNTVTIRQDTKYKVTDIGFEYSFIPISSSNRDEDSVSDFDKYESNIIKQSGSAHLQNKVNYQNTMDNLEKMYGPFDQEEIDLYLTKLMTDPDGESIINRFQRDLIFDMFYKYFKDTESIKCINKIDYAKMIIIMKKELLSKNMVILPYILSGKMEKVIQRKNVNKQELSYIENSQYYPLILNKYKDLKILDIIKSTIGTMISSDFTIVDLNKDINGEKIEIIPQLLVEEFLPYILYC